MKVTSTIPEFPPHAFRQLIGWCCDQTGLPRGYLRAAAIRRTSHLWSGRAYLSRRTIGVRLGDGSGFPHQMNRHRSRVQLTIEDRVEAWVWVTAHEIIHHRMRIELDQSRQRGGLGGSEFNVNWEAARVLKVFKENREALLAQWFEAPVVREPAKVDVIEARAVKASKQLTDWTRKLKLAQTKVRKYRQRVNYYERKAAERGGS